MKVDVRLALITSAAAYAVIIGGSAAAQDRPLAAAVNEAKVGPADIIVTATRREQSLQDVPIAVAVVSQDQLKASNVADTIGLVQLVPSLNFSRGSTAKDYTFLIRGVGTYINSEGFEKSVGVAIDGVPIARAVGSIADLVDLNRIEVLEGPQGMLFGKNASAGLVNIITNNAKLDQREYIGRIGYGNYNEMQASATVNLPISDTLAIRGSAWNFRHDGYVKAPGRDLGAKNSHGARLKVLWEPSASTSVNVSANWAGADQDPSVFTIRAFVEDTNDVTTHETGMGIIAGPENQVTSSMMPISNDQQSSSYALAIDHDFGPATLSSVTAYRRVHNRDLFDPAAVSTPLYDSITDNETFQRQFSQELRLASNGSPRLSYVLGLIYFQLKVRDLGSFFSIGSAPFELATEVTTHIDSKQYAAFGELTYKLTPSLRIIVGGRVSRDEVSGSFLRGYLVPPSYVYDPVNGPGASFGPFAASAAVKTTQPSYRFGVQYDVAPDVMFYVTGSRGYKGAGLDFNFTSNATGFASTGFVVKPEIARNYEVGVRSQLFDRMLTLNMTAFAETFSDFQTSVRLPIATVAFATQNAKELKSTGIEGTADLRLPGGLSLTGSAAYVHARFTDFDNAPCYPRQPTAPTGTPLAPGICVDDVQSINGQQLGSSPKVTVNATARWDGEMGGVPVFGQASYRYQSKTVFNSSGDPFERQGSYSLVNLAAGIRTSDNVAGISFYAKNIFNKRFVNDTVANLFAAYYTQVVPYEARSTYGMSVDFKF